MTGHLLLRCTVCGATGTAEAFAPPPPARAAPEPPPREPRLMAELAEAARLNLHRYVAHNPAAAQGDPVLAMAKLQVEQLAHELDQAAGFNAARAAADPAAATPPGPSGDAPRPPTPPGPA